MIILDVLLIFILGLTIHSDYKFIAGLAVIAAGLLTVAILYITGSALIYSGSKDVWKDFSR